MSKLFAVYVYGWNDQPPSTAPTENESETHLLLGLCRDSDKADRIVARLRRSGRAAVRKGARSRLALIGCSRYDPYHFIPASERAGLSRREAHNRAFAGAVTRRAELGLR